MEITTECVVMYLLDRSAGVPGRSEIVAGFTNRPDREMRCLAGHLSHRNCNVMCPQAHRLSALFHSMIVHDSIFAGSNRAGSVCADSICARSICAGACATDVEGHL